MKKVSLCIFIITVLLFTSCKNQPKDSVSPSSSDATAGAPEYVTNLYKSYQKVAKDNNLSFQVRNFRIEKSEDKNFTWMIIDFFPLNSNSPLEMHSLYADVNKKTFKIFIESTLKDENPQMLKDIISATILVLDNTLSSDTAKVKTQSFVNSIDDDKFSDILEIADYKIVFPPKPINFGIFPKYSLCIQHISELNEKVNIDEYPEVVFENIDKPNVNAGMKYKIQGKILENHVEPFYGLGSTMKVLSSDGKQYMIKYSHIDFLKTFEINKTYTFYGAVTDKLADLPTLALYYYE